MVGTTLHWQSKGGKGVALGRLGKRALRQCGGFRSTLPSPTLGSHDTPIEAGTFLSAYF